VAYVYDENSFLAGLLVGRTLKGWATYSSWDPVIIIPPVIEKFAPLYFGPGHEFSIAEMMDSVILGFPSREDITIAEEIPYIYFQKDVDFKIMELNERLVIDEVRTAYSIDKDINPLEYDDTIVFINSSGAFTMDQMTREFTSTEQTVNIGTMQEVTVVTDEFAEVDTQEVTAG